MELHVKDFHVTHVKLVLAVFDKEIPCHFFLGIRTCDYEAETVKKTKANFRVKGAHFGSKIDLKSYQNSTLCFDRFGVRFGTHFGRIWEANIDARWAKLGSRRLLKLYLFKNMSFHEKL